MDNAGGVRGVQPVGDFDRQWKQRVEREGTRRLRFRANPLLQRGSIEKLHNDEQLVAIPLNLVNRANVRMIQRGGRPRLSPQALDRMWILLRLCGKEL